MYIPVLKGRMPRKHYSSFFATFHNICSRFVKPFIVYCPFALFWSQGDSFAATQMATQRCFPGWLELWEGTLLGFRQTVFDIFEIEYKWLTIWIQQLLNKNAHRDWNPLWLRKSRELKKSSNWGLMSASIARRRSW